MSTLHRDFPLASEPPFPAGQWFQLGLALSTLCLGICLAGTPADRQWLLSIQSVWHDQAQWWMGITWSALGICGTLWLTALSAKEPRRVAAFLLALVIGGLVVHLIKRNLQLDRPLAFFGPNFPGFQIMGEALYTKSMPSGHATTAWAVAALLVLSEGRAAWWRHVWWLLAAAQSVSRIVVGAHWPSDVLVGTGLGLSLSLFVWHLPVTARLARWVDRAVVRRGIALLLPLLGIGLCVADLAWSLPLEVQASVMALSLWGAWQWWRARPTA
jgi:membrane-associated phospholipid phosphatase